MKIVYPIKDKLIIDKIKDYLKHKNTRDYLIFKISIELGIELKDYTQHNVKFYKDICNIGYIENNLGGKVYINNTLKYEILEYIRDKSDDELMFQSRKKGKHLTRQQIYRILNDASEYLGLDFTLNCSTLSKTFAYLNYLEFKDLVNLKKVLRLKSDNDVLEYIGEQG